MAILIQGYLRYEIESTMRDTPVVVELVISGSVVSNWRGPKLSDDSKSLD